MVFKAYWTAIAIAPNWLLDEGIRLEIRMYTSNSTLGADRTWQYPRWFKLIAYKPHHKSSATDQNRLLAYAYLLPMPVCP